MSDRDLQEIRSQAIKAVAKHAGVPASSFEGDQVRVVLAVVFAQENRGRVARIVGLIRHEVVHEAQFRAYQEGKRHGLAEARSNG